MSTPDSLQPAAGFYAARGERYGFTVSPLLDGQPYTITEPGEHISVQRPEVSDNARDLYKRIITAALFAANVRQAYPSEWAGIPSVYESQTRSINPITQSILKRSEAAEERHISQVPMMLVPRTAKAGTLRDVTVQALRPKAIDQAELTRLQKHINNVRKHNGHSPLDISETKTEDLRTYLEVSSDLYQASSISNNPNLVGRLSATVLATHDIWHQHLGNDKKSMIGPRIYALPGRHNVRLVGARIAQGRPRLSEIDMTPRIKRSPNRETI